MDDADVGGAPRAVREQTTFEGWYVVTREPENEHLELRPCRFEDLTWRPKATIHAENARPGLEGTPAELASIEELEGVEHALLPPERHEVTNAEIAELESEHDVAKWEVTTALEHAYRQQDPQGYKRTWESDEADSSRSGTDEALAGRVVSAETTLREHPRDDVAHRERLACLGELARRQRRRAGTHTA